MQAMVCVYLIPGHMDHDPIVYQYPFSQSLQLSSDDFNQTRSFDRQPLFRPPRPDQRRQDHGLGTLLRTQNSANV